MRPLFLYLTVLVAALGESTAFVGLMVPGVGVVVGMSVLAARGEASLAAVGALAALGGVVGFGGSYHLGRLGGPRIARWGGRAQGAVARAEGFFRRFGGWSVFWGHFFGPVRAFVAFAAGAGGMEPKRFWTASVLGALVWGYGLAFSGAVLSGGWTLVESQLGRGSLVVVCLVGLLYLTLRLVVGALDLGLRLLPSATGAVLNLLTRTQAPLYLARLESRHPIAVRRLRQRLSPSHATGLLLTCGALACATFAWLFLGIFEDLLFHDPLVQADQNVFHLLQELRTRSGDPIFVAITEFGSGPVVVSALVSATLFLVLAGRLFEAALLFGGFGAGEALMWILKTGVGRPRPFPPVAPSLTSSGAFPSNQAFTALALYGFLAYLGGRAFRKAGARARFRTATGVLIAAVGISLVYLGENWLSDVLGGYALGGIWLTALATAAEARARVGPPAKAEPGARDLRAVAAVALVVAAAWGLSAGLHRPSAAPAPPSETQERLVTPQALDAELAALGQKRVETLSARIVGPARLAIAAPGADLIDTARAAGWLESGPLRSGQVFDLVIRALRRLPDPAAPVYPLFWQGEPQEFALVQPDPTGGRWTARFWRSGLRVEGTGDLWIADVRFEKPPGAFLGLRLPSRPLAGTPAPTNRLTTPLLASGRFRSLTAQSTRLPELLVRLPASP